ncbi:MAG: hypothetical protein DMG54_01395 [Acidobacteria bacterium]|nr:MAG: hypothetical protein DMG54_01395 [Acidobacteriota bacterium]
MRLRRQQILARKYFPLSGSRKDNEILVQVFRIPYPVMFALSLHPWIRLLPRVVLLRKLGAN